jgi:NAD(P)-dependent dehydrogenase (short-subunit alcohol dehydrogenase family)
MKDSKVVLITGASSGIGKACAGHLARRGHRVYGTSRRASPEGCREAAGFTLIQMDVTDDESVGRGVRQVVEQEGRLDVAVNNAGISVMGPIEDTTLDEAKLLFETNFFGVLRVCQAVLPVMREQHSGHIVNISSMAGRVGAPYQGLYTAAKFAVEGLSEALRTEVRHFGVKVVLIEPGDSPTGLASNRIRILRTRAYAQYCNNAMQVYESDERNGYPPEKIAPLVERVIQDPNPRLRYLCGVMFQTAGATLKNFVPYSLFEWALAKVYKF